MKNYKELIIWQRGMEIVKTIYTIIKQFPVEEKFGIVSQITRAAVSIPANIAEGSSRNSDKDYARFLQIALGSAFEIQTYLIISKDMHWAKIDEIEKLELVLEHEIKMIHKFINTLKMPTANS
jgi:four helix bundle protein